MKENLSIIQEIISLAVDISTNQNEVVEFQFYPRTHVLQVSIEMSTREDMHTTELTKSFKVNTSNSRALQVVLEELKTIKTSTDDEFLE